MLKYSYLFLILFFTGCKSEPKQTVESELPVETNVTESDTELGADNTQIILFYGNSLTAGMGLDSNEAFPAIIQQKLDSLDLNFKVINAGLSGETTAGGKSRLDWVLKQETDFFVLELGANDGLRGISLTETRNNLQAIIDHVRAKNPETVILLAGMQLPPNLGKSYTGLFKNIFPELAKKNNLHLIPFILDGVAGDPTLNQSDGIHPTAEGHQILAQNVWKVLENLVLSHKKGKK